jgi:hypothetical protein
LAKASEAQAAKDAKRMDAFINRKTNGKFGEYSSDTKWILIAQAVGFGAEILPLKVKLLG